MGGAHMAMALKILSTQYAATNTNCIPMYVPSFPNLETPLNRLRIIRWCTDVDVVVSDTKYGLSINRHVTKNDISSVKKVNSSERRALKKSIHIYLKSS